MKLLAPLSLMAMGLLSGTAMAAPNVVASIKPVHSLVAAVMAGVGEPVLIVKGAASPHIYALRPSDADALETADIVFWTGHGLELFLGDALETLATQAEVVELARSPGIELLPLREGGTFEAHAHDGEDHDHADHEHAHEHDEGDMHFWLDPQNAALMVAQIAATLSEVDPDNAATYSANAETEIATLAALEGELAERLAPVRDKPFIVFHDAYQYFEARFGLTLAGSVTVSPEVAPGAARIDELRTRVQDLGATCVFAEPNFEPAISSAITDGTQAKAGVLDPEGSALGEGVNLYPELLRGLATSLVDCLG
jgi:zinc transport system substrate-binding protein